MLVAGYHVDALVAQELKEATHSEFLFLTPGRVIASTLNPRATAAVVADIGANARRRTGERWRHGIRAVQDAAARSERQAGGRDLHSAILRSGAERASPSLYTNIILLWLVRDHRRALA